MVSLKPRSVANSCALVESAGNPTVASNVQLPMAKSTEFVFVVKSHRPVDVVPVAHSTMPGRVGVPTLPLLLVAPVPLCPSFQIPNVLPEVLFASYIISSTHSRCVPA